MIKNNLSIKFHSEHVYDKAYIKAKVREFRSMIKTNFYTCIAFITIDSVMRIDKKTIHKLI